MVNTENHPPLIRAPFFDPGEQLTELEILESMFPGPGELTIEDPLTLAELTEFTSGGASQSPPSSCLALRLSLAGLEAVVRLPLGYPATARPEIYLRWRGCCPTVRLSLDILAVRNRLSCNWARGASCIVAAVKLKGSVKCFRRNGASQGQDYQGKQRRAGRD